MQFLASSRRLPPAGSSGCYFTRFAKEESLKLGITGWIKNTKAGSIVGKIQGERDKVNEM